ncbi:tRNA (adenosine(37)-N6)-threonylcarbamoyltransferase complex ATPase subunit type 1 TsaE [Nitrincola tapanii]|uniref:tRNA threonylcarbamoyladenosine biosynthesis protein TsaE n=1 Tax=Nitrincola tapanii TaxID=1708751 RepID=A0A5A9W593_9GAMM|nr:tRNA (adenosine(37)-N6)-threonylcarbamoyltransferase complex ATPase subunit type 1 TsaE [Nitrincola tapanii]KAA0874741.1 tRNA (adenosine(37)-N6)-threonylcarbamoyltransferase complex ATPase subunit type 1 TsaE [Nitrincola tapanii]
MIDTSIEQYIAADTEATEAFGRLLAESASAGAFIFLHGDLGMGKTTLCRGVLQALGHKGAVKSPTYTLVEPYELATQQVYHFDLYRLGDPEELEFLGIRDYLGAEALCLIEWPEKGRGWLPTADLEITLSPYAEGRLIKWSKNTQKGCMIADRISNKLNG